MATTLLAIFAIALVATLAWVITRIVNIFVEIEELKKKTNDILERLYNNTNRVTATLGTIKQLQELHEKRFEIEHKFVKEQCDQLTEIIQILDKRIECGESRVGTLSDIVEDKFLNSMQKELDKLQQNQEKNKRVAEYTKAREEGKTIRQAGDAVGVSYPTAKRYEKQRKAQSNETGNN